MMIPFSFPWLQTILDPAYLIQYWCSLFTIMSNRWWDCRTFAVKLNYFLAENIGHCQLFICPLTDIMSHNYILNDHLQVLIIQIVKYIVCFLSSPSNIKGRLETNLFLLCDYCSSINRWHSKINCLPNKLLSIYLIVERKCWCTEIRNIL